MRRVAFGFISSVLAGWKSSTSPSSVAATTWRDTATYPWGALENNARSHVSRRSNSRRRLLRTTTRAALIAALSTSVSVGVSPVAHAASEGASVSTLAPSSPVSGTATSTATRTLSSPGAWMEVDFDPTQYTTAAVTLNNAADCAAYNIVLKINGTVVLIDTCQNGTYSSGGITYRYLYVDSLVDAANGDVITLMWGSTYVSTTASGASSLRVYNPSTNTAVTLTPTVTGGGGGGSSSGSSSTTSAPDPIVQQFGKPASGTCADSAPESLNWGGSSSGGWGESWAQWMNGGTGGAVCTRTLVHSTSSGAWAAS